MRSIGYDASRPPARDRANRNAIVNAAPANAAAGRTGREGASAVSPAAVAANAPRAAPPDTPRMYGSASGLRRIAWKTAPAAPNAAPAIAARSRRGSRSLRIVVEASSPLNNPPSPTPLLPIAAPATRVARRAATRSARDPTRRRVVSGPVTRPPASCGGVQGRAHAIELEDVHAAEDAGDAALGDDREDTPVLAQHALEDRQKVVVGRHRRGQ